MTLKNLSLKKSSEDFLRELYYLGVAIEPKNSSAITNFIDLEEFFISATYNLLSSRIAEGVLCWLLRYGHLLSPSKTRRLIQLGTPVDSSVLGGFLAFLIKHRINSRQWNIVKPYSHRSKKPKVLFLGPCPHTPDPVFLKFNIMVHNYKLNQEKFLTPTAFVYKNCVELRNRALFGSTVNADVASYLKRNPDATPYQIAKNTRNHKARVFEVFNDIKVALP